MHGLINRSIQCFLRDTYGAQVWADISAATGIGAEGFEALQEYDDALTDAVLDAAALRLARSRDALLEDLGTWLIFGQGLGWLRRLLRFGGAGFVDFLHSLDDLPDRARLALPDLVLPRLEVAEHSANRFTITARGGWPGVGLVLMGALRAMADDYGALAILEHEGQAFDPAGGAERVCIELLDQSFAEGRRFRLAGYRSVQGATEVSAEIAGLGSGPDPGQGPLPEAGP